MKNIYRIVVLLATVGAVATVLTLKSRQVESEPETKQEATGRAIPRLVDLGAGKCASCKLMTPVLAALKREFADSFTTEFIDVWENPDATDKYGIRMIPTQIFFDAAGKELYRHEGFFSREDILATWKQHGIIPSPTVN
ncbi:MAG: thioredoxin family protein [Kiritimatiellae bacterium]|nr:thioredoxin family protein [Kiritimatiellia bacterium]